MEDALALAEKFWDELQQVMAALEDIQEQLKAREPPGIELKVIEVIEVQKAEPRRDQKAASTAPSSA